MSKTTVSSWNDFDPLEHVIVGRADFTCIPPSEPATEAKIPEDSDMRGMWGPRPLETVEKANAELDQWGVMCPARIPIVVARSLFIRMYPRMAEIIQLLGSSSLMALPAEVDLDGPLAEHIEKYLHTDTASARDRIQLFHLAWDLACSAFGSRQVLYERFFQGDWMRNAAALCAAYDTAPLRQQIEDFLADT